MKSLLDFFRGGTKGWVLILVHRDFKVQVQRLVLRPVPAIGGLDGFGSIIEPNHIFLNICMLLSFPLLLASFLLINLYQSECQRKETRIGRKGESKKRVSIPFISRLESQNHTMLKLFMLVEVVVAGAAAAAEKKMLVILLTDVQKITYLQVFYATVAVEMGFSGGCSGSREKKIRGLAGAEKTIGGSGRGCWGLTQKRNHRSAILLTNEVKTTYLLSFLPCLRCRWLCQGLYKKKTIVQVGLARAAGEEGKIGQQKGWPTLQKKLDQLHAVDMQHAPAKLTSKLHMLSCRTFGTVTFHMVGVTNEPIDFKSKTKTRLENKEVRENLENMIQKIDERKIAEIITVEEAKQYRETKGKAGQEGKAESMESSLTVEYFRVDVVELTMSNQRLSVRKKLIVLVSTESMKAEFQQEVPTQIQGLLGRSDDQYITPETWKTLLRPEQGGMSLYFSLTLNPGNPALYEGLVTTGEVVTIHNRLEIKPWLGSSNTIPTWLKSVLPSSSCYQPART
ncbi:hypothetical protein VP01_1157g1 [Puccinia sorghi]|uniref:Uncharacterized protein n=1 Tax=Puccinia sorghi TaxID=27349 RepID=A0A0L6VRL7_9BASI|nr:hypothetical protein VP01_1157g1 [Puccinia sorghi]